MPCFLPRVIVMSRAAALKWIEVALALLLVGGFTVWWGDFLFGLRADHTGRPIRIVEDEPGWLVFTMFPLALVLTLFIATLRHAYDNDKFALSIIRGTTVGIVVITMVLSLGPGRWLSSTVFLAS
jgi:hypothetical protein